MDNTFQMNDGNQNDNLDYKNNSPKKNNIAKSPKINRKSSSPKKQHKESACMPNLFSLEEELKNLEEEKLTITDNIRKSSMPEDIEREAIKKFDLKKESAKNDKKEGRVKKKDGINRKFIRKNAKKILRRDGNPNNKIRVKGTVSAKLNELIQRLGQNNTKTEDTNTNQFGDKVVMAPRIKAALEKFNKKRDEKPQIIHFGGGRRIRKIINSNEEANGNKDNNDIYDDEEYEYEDDEEYEEYEYEEEEDDEKEQEELDEVGENENRIHRQSVGTRREKLDDNIDKDRMHRPSIRKRTIEDIDGNERRMHRQSVKTRRVKIDDNFDKERMHRPSMKARRVKIDDGNENRMHRPSIKRRRSTKKKKNKR